MKCSRGPWSFSYCLWRGRNHWDHSRFSNRPVEVKHFQAIHRAVRYLVIKHFQISLRESNHGSSQSRRRRRCPTPSACSCRIRRIWRAPPRRAAPASRAGRPLSRQRGSILKEGAISRSRSLGATISVWISGFGAFWGQSLLIAWFTPYLIQGLGFSQSHAALISILPWAIAPVAQSARDGCPNDWSCAASRPILHAGFFPGLALQRVASL